MVAGLNFSGARRLPLVLQSEAAECGLACLAMAAGFHGYDVDLLTLRRRYPLSLKGATLAQVMHIASQVGFTCRPLRLELEDLKLLKLPAVLHWDLNHFVVLRKVGSRNIIIHDPASGEKRLGNDEVSKHFTGIALELTPAPGFVRKRERQQLGLWSVWGRHTGSASTIAQILVFSLSLQVCVLLAPLFMQIVVDQVLVSRDQNLLTVLGVGFLLLTVITVALTAIRSWVLLYLSNVLNFQAVSNLFAHLLKLPMEFFEKRHVGDVMSRFGSLKTIQDTITNSFIEALVDGTMVLGTLAMMWIYSPLLAGVTLGLVLLYVALRFAIYRPLRQASEEKLVRTARKDTSFLEAVHGIQSIKLFGAEASRGAAWQHLLADSMNADIRVSRLGIGFGAANGLLFGISNILVVWLGARAVMEGGLSVGMLFAFVSYKGTFTDKAAALVEKLIAYRLLNLHADRVADIALAEPVAEMGIAASLPDVVQGGIAVRKLSFRYSESDPYIIKDLDLDIRAGESVAIVGPSGCGKTTLAKIMLGLLTPESGTVALDGRDVRNIGLANYRRHVAAVMQDDQLFAGSIADNIAFFDMAADQQKVERCARLAAIHDDILAMPMAYNSLIGDMGAALSGGQRQRILLARALYREPSILFLDEATSHLDVARERDVNHAIRDLRITRIIIAHRTETIGSADRVIRLGGQNLEVHVSMDREPLRVHS